MKKKPSVFISYNHDSRAVVEELVERLEDVADVHWDNNLGPWESFSSFMDTIRNQDFAVLIISDAYLKSKACQYEVVRLMNIENWDRRSMFVVEESAREIYKEHGRREYIDYWDAKERELSAELSKHSAAGAKDIVEEILDIQRIKLHIGVFMRKIADSNNPEISDAIIAITDRMKISAKRNKSSDIDKYILKLLAGETMSAYELAQAFNRKESTIVKYLRKLKRMGMVNEIKDAHGRRYIASELNIEKGNGI